MQFRNVRRLWLFALRLHPQSSAQFQSKSYSVGEAFPSPPDPISCCGSGCQNCVWVEFADAVGKYAKRLAAEHPDIDPDSMTEKSIDLIRQEIEKNIDDPVLKTYVSYFGIGGPYKILLRKFQFLLKIWELVRLGGDQVTFKKKFF